MYIKGVLHMSAERVSENLTLPLSKPYVRIFRRNSLPQFSKFADPQGNFICHCLNSLVSSPMPSIATVTLLIGSFIDPTPSHVPQQIRSPGNSVKSCEILLTSCCALKIMSDIGYDWRSSPFSTVRTTSLAGSIPDAMTGPNGQKSS